MRVIAGQWKHVRPNLLKAGDVVTVIIHKSGNFEIHCNGVHQVTWTQANVDTDKDLYPLVGMRAPLKAVALRQKVHDITKLGAGPVKTITLKGIDGKVGEIIDLMKHGRPSYPAAFENVRAVSDIRSLYPLLLKEHGGREYGRKQAQPILIRAGPGTGKTWCVMQLLFFFGTHYRFTACRTLPYGKGGF